MMSTITAIFPTDPVFSNTLPTFGNGFTTSWDSSAELFSTIHSPEPLISRTSSAEPNDPNRNSANTNSGSYKPNQKRSDSIVDERKRRRMISNRESARRSRMRKQKHTENLQSQVNRLRIENRDLSNRLRSVLLDLGRVRTDNDRLRSEHVMLGQKMSYSYMNQVSLPDQLQQFEQQQFFPPAWLCNDLMVEPTGQNYQINNYQFNKLI